MKYGKLEKNSLYFDDRGSHGGILRADFARLFLGDDSFRGESFFFHRPLALVVECPSVLGGTPGPCSFVSHELLEIASRDQRLDFLLEIMAIVCGMTFDLVEVTPVLRVSSHHGSFPSTRRRRWHHVEFLDFLVQCRNFTDDWCEVLPLMTSKVPVLVAYSR